MIINDGFFLELDSRIKSIQKDLEEVKEKVKSPVEGEWLTVKDVARIFSFSVRSQATYRKKGILPFSEMGGRIIYNYSDIEKAIRDGAIDK